MDQELIAILSQSDLFSNINLTAIESFLKDNPYRIEKYSKNDLFSLEGDPVNHLMIVLKGALIARMVSDSGKYIQIDKIEAGRVIAPAMLFASENRFPVNVIPEGDATVFFMSRSTFLKAMNRNETLLHNFIRLISDINRFLSTKIHSLSLKSIRGKLAEYILQEAVNQNNNSLIRFNQTRQELADKFAISRQALIRSLTELENEGLIGLQGREVKIMDRARLRDER